MAEEIEQGGAEGANNLENDKTGERRRKRNRKPSFEKHLEYLLRNLDDRESADKDLRGLWLEHYEKFREQAPAAVVNRFKSLLQDERYGLAEWDVESVLLWVMSGGSSTREVLRPIGEHDPWNEEVLRHARDLSYEKAKALLAQVLRFPRASDYDAFLLSVAQTYVLDLLDKVWYLAFVGPMSSGKTTATKAWAYLADRTYHVATVTAAAIVDIMQKAHGLAIDEVDATLRRGERDLVEALLRQGTERGQPYVKMIEVLQGGQRQHVLKAVPTFGPKVFNYRGRLEDALTSRADIIELKRAKDPALRRRARRLYEHLAPLKAWLELEAGRALATWTPESVREYETSEEFVALSDSLRVELDRTGEIGDLMLLVGHIMGWPVEKVVQERLDNMAAAIEEPVVEEVREELLMMVEENQYRVGDEWRIPKVDLRTRLNLARKDRGEREIRGNDLATALRELGVTNEIRPRSGHRRRCLILTRQDVERLKALIEGDGPPGPLGPAPLSRWDNGGGPCAGSGGWTGGGPPSTRCLAGAGVPPGPPGPITPREEGCRRGSAHMPESAGSSGLASSDSAEKAKGEEEEPRRLVRSLAVLARLRSPEESLDGISARIVDTLRMHGRVVDLGWVQTEVKDVLERMATDSGLEGRFSCGRSGGD